MIHFTQTQNTDLSITWIKGIFCMDSSLNTSPVISLNYTNTQITNSTLELTTKY